MSLIGLLVALIILVLIVWAAGKLLAVSGLPAEVRQVLYVAIVVVAVIVFLLRLTGAGPIVLR